MSIPDPCPCHRCLEAEGKAVVYLEHDFCYAIARNIDEDGNYHDDGGIYRDGQTHVEIVCSGCVVCNTGNAPPFWYSGCAHCIIKGATGTGRRYEVIQ